MSVAQIAGKACSRCRQWKSMDAFWRNPEHPPGTRHTPSPLGRNSACKACLSRANDYMPLARERMLQARERAVKIFRMHDYGLTWAEIGRQLGMTRERARQLGNTGEIVARMRARREIGIIGDEDE